MSCTVVVESDQACLESAARIAALPGLLSLEVLKDKKGSSYLTHLRWDSEESHEACVNHPMWKEGDGPQGEYQVRVLETVKGYCAKSANRDLILRYFQSWQKKDWKTMRESLVDKPEFSGGMPFKDADDFVNMCKNQGSPWTDVRLLGSIFDETGGALFYEGFDTGSKKIFQVAELVQVQAGKITKLRGVFTTKEAA